MKSSCLIVEGSLHALSGASISQPTRNISHPQAALPAQQRLAVPLNTRFLPSHSIAHNSVLLHNAPSIVTASSQRRGHRSSHVSATRAVFVDPAAGPRRYSTLQSNDGRDFGTGLNVLYDTPQRGAASPLGSTLAPGRNGVNFAVITDGADAVSLCLFTEEDLQRGSVTAEVPLDPLVNRTGDVWHIFLPALSKNLLYGWQVQEPFIPEDGLRFDGTKILHPYAKAVVSRSQYGTPGKDGNCWPQLAGAVPDEEDNRYGNMEMVAHLNSTKKAPSGSTKATAAILQSGIIACIKIENQERALNAARAALDGGVTALELTMSVPRALESVRTLVNEYPDAAIGVGTIYTVDEAEAAAGAGAHFVMSPVFNEEIVRFQVESDVLYIPGAMTPTEIWTAYRSGCRIVKVFPASEATLRALRRPLARLAEPPLSLIASHGIGEDDIRHYLGDRLASAVVLSDTIFGHDRSAADITAAAQRVVALADGSRQF